MGATVKGAVAKAGHDYIRETYGEAAWRRVLALLPDEDRRLLDEATGTEQFPVAVDGRLFASLVAVQFEGDRVLAEAELRKGGAHQADALLDGLFDFFARFVSPQQAFRSAGPIFTSVYSKSVTSSTDTAPGGGGGAIHVVGLGESTFIAPWQCGLIERGLYRFGAKSAKVTERCWESGLDACVELIYDVSWE